MNIDSFDKSSANIESEERDLKIKKVLNLFHFHELKDVKLVRKNWNDRINEKTSQEYLEKEGIVLKDEDYKFLESSEFETFSQEFLNEKVDLYVKNNLKDQTLTLKVAKLISNIGVDQMTNIEEAKQMLIEKFKNYPEELKAMETEGFSRAFQEIKEAKQNETMKIIKNNIHRAFQGLWAADFRKKNEVGDYKWCKSKAHHKVTNLKLEVKKQSTGTLGFKKILQKEYDNFIVSKNYLKMFEEARNVYIQEEIEIANKFFDLLTYELAELIESKQLHRFKEIFQENKWVANSEYKDEEIKRRALNYSKLNQIETLEELKGLDIYDLAMSVYLQQTHLKNKLVKKKTRKERPGK